MELLGASAQELFDAYSRLKHRAGDLITGADLLQPSAADSLPNAEFVEGRLGTFGTQALFPPLIDGAALSSALLRDIIAFRSKVTGISAGVPESRIALDPSKRYELDQIVWGRICTVVDNPEVRLNVLLILRDPLLFRVYDCSAYLEASKPGAGISWQRSSQSVKPLLGISGSRRPASVAHRLDLRYKFCQVPGRGTFSGIQMIAPATNNDTFKLKWRGADLALRQNGLARSAGVMKLELKQ